MENRANVLREMNICRFCLSDDSTLTNIYVKAQPEHGGGVTKTVPLPLQLMACVAIEAFENDGMPQMICESCRFQAQQAYTFKTNCKKADDSLKVFLATGSLVKPWTQQEFQEQRKLREASNKRLEQQSSLKTPPSKRPKRDVSIVTIYSNTDSASNQTLEGHSNPEEHQEELSTHVIQHVEEVPMSEEHMETGNYSEQDLEDETVDEEHLDEVEDEEYDESDDEQSQHHDENEPQHENILNRTLKVSQVQTDVFPCSECHRSFPLKQLLDLHQANHARERNFTCDECDKSFFSKYDLGKHMVTHQGSKPFTCVVCEKSFARESLLHRHQKIHVDVPKYLCSQCDRTFFSGEELDAHAAKHKKKRPYVCKVCTKSFVFKQGLERHEQSHSTVKPHKCNYCEASFTSAIKLTRHVTSHAGLRPYPCKLCGRTFLLSHHLTRHMRSHYAAAKVNPEDEYVPSVIGQHKCDICSMSFRRKDSLINHSAIHSMVNLKCVICNTEFDNVNKVKQHITTHLSDLPYPCEKCDYSFETQEQLEDHELKHAEMEYEEQIEQEVIAEAREAAKENDGGDEEGLEDEDGDNSDYSGDGVAEFTITNDMNNPEIVRRSKRPSKIKNYAEFLKDELGSDIDESELKLVPKLDEDGQHPDQPQREEYQETIKPIVRSEGTKVYARKPEQKPKTAATPQRTLVYQNKVETPTTPQLLNTFLTTDLSKMPEKERFNMKIGDKTVTVQKLLLTKEQMRAMAREGKLEKKGNMLLKKSSNQALENLNLESLFGPSVASTPKTYTKRITSEELSFVATPEESL